MHVHIHAGIPSSYLTALNTLAEGDGVDGTWTADEVRRLRDAAGGDVWKTTTGRGLLYVCVHLSVCVCMVCMDG